MEMLTDSAWAGKSAVALAADLVAVWETLLELEWAPMLVDLTAMQTVKLTEVDSEQPTEILKEMSLVHLSAVWMAMPTAQMMEMCLVQLMGIRLEQLTDLQKGANWAEN